MFDHTLLVCIALATVGSLFYVFGILSLAYPTFLVQNKRGGQPWERWQEICFFSLYVVGQGGALTLPTVASWYGPTSIILPVYQATMLMWNLVLMSLLGMETFKKHQKVGTAIIMVSTVMLMDAGPKPDGSLDEEVFSRFGTTTSSIAWLCFLSLLWTLSTVGMVRDFRNGEQFSTNYRMAIYVVAQSIGTSGTTLCGKSIALAQGNTFVVVCIAYAFVGVTNTWSSIIAAKKLNQATFIPFASVASLLVNACTGLVLWEDWRSIETWVSYTCIHALICLGIYDLTSDDQFLKHTDSARETLREGSFGRRSQSLEA